MGEDCAFKWSVEFIENSSPELGGAIFVSYSDGLDISGAVFKSNEASLGGAVYILSVTNNQHIFRDCGFEENVAQDGGAFYLNTAMAVDIFIGSVFRNNHAGEFVTTCSVCMQNGPMWCSE